MNTVSKIAFGLLFGFVSTIHAHGYLSLGAGESSIGTTNDYHDTAYKIALGLQVADNIALEIHHADLGKAESKISYKYTGVGGNYYFGSEDDSYIPFIGGGIAVYVTNDEIDERVQPYGTGGVKFTLDQESGIGVVVSYTRYADDGSVGFFDIVQQF